jgi:hypothetical protein
MGLPFAPPATGGSLPVGRPFWAIANEVPPARSAATIVRLFRVSMIILQNAYAYTHPGFKHGEKPTVPNGSMTLRCRPNPPPRGTGWCTHFAVPPAEMHDASVVGNRGGKNLRQEGRQGFRRHLTECQQVRSRQRLSRGCKWHRHELRRTDNRLSPINGSVGNHLRDLLGGGTVGTIRCRSYTTVA